MFDDQPREGWRSGKMDPTRKTPETAQGENTLTSKTQKSANYRTQRRCEISHPRLRLEIHLHYVGPPEQMR